MTCCLWDCSELPDCQKSRRVDLLFDGLCVAKRLSTYSLLQGLPHSQACERRHVQACVPPDRARHLVMWPGIEGLSSGSYYQVRHALNWYLLTLRRFRDVLGIATYMYTSVNAFIAVVCLPVSWRKRNRWKTSAPLRWGRSDGDRRRRTTTSTMTTVGECACVGFYALRKHTISTMYMCMYLYWYLCFYCSDGVMYSHAF